MKKKHAIIFAVIVVAVSALLIANESFRWWGVSNYQKVTNTFTRIEVAEAMKMDDENVDHLLYIGRETCPYCVEFVPILKEMAEELGQKVYYLDSEGTQTNDGLKAFRAKWEVQYVPTLIYFNGEEGITIDVEKPKEEMLAELKAAIEK